MKSFRCVVCGYICVSEEVPSTCPVCGAPEENFEVVKDEKAKNPKTKESGHQEKAHVDFRKVVVLGGGIAALSAVETLRDLHDDIEITMITNEASLPYYRLNLTRFLSGEIDESDLYIHGQYWFDDQRIKVFKNRVITDIDRENRKVLTGDQLEVEYDRLIIALGAHPFVPPIRGVHQEGVYSLRSIEDARDMKKLVSQGTRVMVIGGGVLGLETAGALANLGAEVRVAEGSSWLMPRQLNQAGGEVLEKYIGELGIHILFDYRTNEIIKTEEGLLVKGSGGDFEADLIVMATGVRPNTYLARKANLEVNHGLVVDDHLKTSDDRIYGIGDISEHYGVAYGLWTIAQYQGKIAAMNLMGQENPFGGVPRSNMLKVLGVDLFSIGEIQAIDASYEVIEKKTDKAYLMFVLHDGYVVGSIAVGYPKFNQKIKVLVEGKENIGHLQISNAEDMIAYLNK